MINQEFGLTIDNVSEHINQMDGVFIVFLYLNHLVLLSVPPKDLEPIGKAEAIIDETGISLIPLTLNMFSFISGGLEPGESHLDAALREGEEEAFLKLDPGKLIDISGETRTLQSRNGQGFFDIKGKGYSYELNINEFRELILALNQHGRDALIGKLDQFLPKIFSLELRPFAQSVFPLLANLNQ